MLTTVTTTTASMAATSTIFGVAGTVVLILLLIAKELSSSHEGVKARWLESNLNVAIVPLLITFGLIVFLKAWEVLS
ncbi:MAG: hypothetical protein ACLFVI_00810 [Archaeoglobaceae archaeon]